MIDEYTACKNLWKAVLTQARRDLKSLEPIFRLTAYEYLTSDLGMLLAQLVKLPTQEIQKECAEYEEERREERAALKRCQVDAKAYERYLEGFDDRLEIVKQLRREEEIAKERAKEKMRIKLQLEAEQAQRRRKEYLEHVEKYGEYVRGFGYVKTIRR